MAKQEIEMHGLEEDDISETPVTRPKAVAGEPLKGTIAYDRKYGKYTAKGALRKKQNTATPPKNESEEIDEMDFGSIGKTLSKYGKGVPADGPKTPKRSTVHTDYTMTGHKEGKSTTGRVYTKAPEMDREPEAVKATAKTDQVEAPKRCRGRPAGAANKAGTGKGWSAEAKASMKAKLAARKAAKLAAANESVELSEAYTTSGTVHTNSESSGPAKFKVKYDDFPSKHDIQKQNPHLTTSQVYAVHAHIDDHADDDMSGTKSTQRNTEYHKAKTNSVGPMSSSSMHTHKVHVTHSTGSYDESEEIEELSKNTLQAYRSKALVAHQKKINTGEGKSRAASLQRNDRKIKSIEQDHEEKTQGYVGKVGQRFKYNESVELTEEDWADIVEDQSLDSIVEFMMEEEYQSLDELSKKTLGSYIKKAAGSSTVNATAAMHGKNREAEARTDAEYYRKAKEPENAKLRDAYADIQHKASYNATETSIKRLKGIAKATDRLTKESVEHTDEIEEAKKDSFGMPSHHIDKVKQKIRDGIWEPQTDLKANAHVEIRHTKTGKRETIHVRESEELDEAHDGTFKVGDVVSVDYHDISGKTHHGTANVDKATKGFVHVQHPSINGMTLKFHQTVNGKNTANEVGTLPGTRAGGHRITKLDTNESAELDEAKGHKPGYVAIAVNPGVSDLAKAGKKYTVYFKPNADSPRGRTKPVDISHHEDIDSAKAAKAAYVEKHKAHGVEALRGMGESTEVVESTEDLNIQRYAALIGKNLIKE